jgi:hypothetical protein
MSHQRIEHDLTNTLSPHACGLAPIALPSGPGATSGEILYAEVYVPVEEVTVEPAPDL